ncbi:hypothetical protein N431DRAFT_326780 [Stipitochalara longipes BDJ]|nr:hypothetical protein N431DRAFT_326780 [Stipitochalara longipes BDJ]
MTPRRSSRLRGSRGSSVTPRKPINYASHHLASLTERDETPTSGTQSNLDAIVSSPLAPRTPATAGRIMPSLEEMHPSKAHHSTTQEPDSGLRLGFVDVEVTGPNQPSGIKQQTPSKISAPTFDFRFAHPAPQLGPEAQRMMDELREEALRIKVKLAAEREEEKRNAREESNSDGVERRKIAQPKGKVGRFSDVHMAEFKKMDSIAGHPSAFRAQLGRFTPTKASLKRSPSKAQLDDKERGYKTAGHASEETERLENTAPAKRARKRVEDDTSTARPASTDEKKGMPTTPILPRSQSSFLTSIRTPTQASLARAVSVKKSTTQIPTLSLSPSKPNLNVMPKTFAKSVTTSNLASSPRPAPKSFLHSPSKFDRVKSILRYPSSSAKKPSAKPTSIPTLSRSPSKPNLDKVLPSIPTTPGENGTSKTTKHVNFTPDTVNKHATTILNSPSPIKSGIPRSTSKTNFRAKYLGGAKTSANVQYPSVADHPSLDTDATKVEYPSLAGVRPLPEAPHQTMPRLPPSMAGTFTFRSDHTISFGASPKSFGSSPGQASVRQVRHSILPNSMPGAFPANNKENTEFLPAVPHGTANKKRRRVDSDGEAEEEIERSPKKHKTAVAEGQMLMAPDLQAPKSKLPTPSRKRGVLSLSRLNMLSRPKMRK